MFFEIVARIVVTCNTVVAMREVHRTPSKHESHYAILIILVYVAHASK